MNILEEIRREFGNDIERVEHLLRLIKGFREFGASTLPSAISDRSVSWPEALSLVNSSQDHRTDLPILSGSLLLYLVGRFEYFIRQIIQVTADEIAEKTSKYLDLPSTLRKDLKRLSLDVAQNPARYGFDENQADAILANLVDNLRGSGTSLTINSLVLSITETNMKERTLADLMKRVGMNEFWRDVGKQAQIKIHLEKKDDNEAMVEAQARLNAIMNERNQIAHPTSATHFPDPDQVLAKVGFLRVLSHVAVEIVQVHLASFRNSTGS